MKIRTMALVVACLMLLFVFVGCSTPSTSTETPAASTKAPSAEAPAPAGETIKIGGLAPLTGNVSVYGIATNNGVKLALDELNANGGLLGSQVEYIVYDEKGDPTEAVNAYNKLVQNDNVIAIIGDVTSTPTLAVVQQAVKDNMPIITATGTASDITAAGENVFRACFIDPFQGEIMASYAANKLGVKTAAVIYDTSDDYSLGLTDSFIATAEELGIEIVAKEGYSGGDVDFKSQLTKIADKKPAVLFVPVYYEDVALIATQARAVGLTATLLGADGWDGVISKVDASNISVLEGSLFCNHYSAESDDPALQAFIKNYKATYNEDPNSFAALGYDAAGMMIQAITTAGSTDSAAIIEAMKNIQYKGITGNIVFDEFRNPIKSAAITTITDGAYKFVEYYEK